MIFFLQYLHARVGQNFNNCLAKKSEYLKLAGGCLDAQNPQSEVSKCKFALRSTGLMVRPGAGGQIGPGSYSKDPAAAGLDAVMLVVPTFLFLRILAFNICTRV